MRGAGSRVKRPRPKGERRGRRQPRGPQAESTLTCALPSLVGKWFTCTGCQGSHGFRAHSDLTCLPLGIICGHAAMFKIVKG